MGGHRRHDRRPLIPHRDPIAERQRAARAGRQRPQLSGHGPSACAVVPSARGNPLQKSRLNAFWLAIGFSLLSRDHGPAIGPGRLSTHRRRSAEGGAGPRPLQGPCRRQRQQIGGSGARSPSAPRCRAAVQSDATCALMSRQHQMSSGGRGRPPSLPEIGEEPFFRLFSPWHKAWPSAVQKLLAVRSRTGCRVLPVPLDQLTSPGRRRLSASSRRVHLHRAIARKRNCGGPSRMSATQPRMCATTWAGGKNPPSSDPLGFSAAPWRPSFVQTVPDDGEGATPMGYATRSSIQ